MVTRMGDVTKANNKSSRVVASLVFFVLSSCTGDSVGTQSEYGVVFVGARVLDPETNLDAVRNVAVTDDRIAAISAEPLSGSRRIDASGMVLAPGFIDLHSHSMGYETAIYQAMDGRTTRLELEAGVYPVGEWYASKEGREPINYGASVSHTGVRLALQELAEAQAPGTLDPSTSPARQRIPESTEADFVPWLTAGLEDGAIGIGSGTQYAPGITRPEMLALSRLAADHDACVFTHIRYGSLVEPNSTLEAVQEAVANAAISGGCVHIVHINSMAMSATPAMIDAVNDARSHGVDVSTEMYPWGASNDRIRSVMFDPGWEERWGVQPGDLQSKATGERLTRLEFDDLRSGTGDDRVLMHMNTEETLIEALQDPQMIIASDAGTLRDRFEHPRTAGTFARVLGHFAREKNAISLLDAVRRMSLLPAQRLEAFVPALRSKGRVQVGADADLVVFDPDAVASGAAYGDAKQYSKGFSYVMVNGTFVVDGGAIVPDVYPGRAVHGGSKVPR